MQAALEKARAGVAALDRWGAGLSVGAATALFTVINVLNYLDRGIVPVRRPRARRVAGAPPPSRAAHRARARVCRSPQGAFVSLGDFIRGDLGTQNTDVQIGLLQSASHASRARGAARAAAGVTFAACGVRDSAAHARARARRPGLDSLADRSQRR